MQKLSCHYTNAADEELAGIDEAEAYALAMAGALRKALAVKNVAADILYEFYTENMSTAELRRRLRAMAEREMQKI